MNKRNLFLIFCFLCLINHSQAKTFIAKCVGIKSGDTITIEYNRQEKMVRLQGVDCPELAQPCGEKVRGYVSEQIYDQPIDLDISDENSTGVLTAMVRLTYGKNLNQDLVEKGMAWSRCKEFAIMEKDARGKHIGIWSHLNPVPPWEFVKNPIVEQSKDIPKPLAINWDLIKQIQNKNSQPSAIDMADKIAAERKRAVASAKAKDNAMWGQAGVAAANGLEWNEIDGTGPVVYITPTGGKYHKLSCRYVKGKNLLKISRSAARARWLYACEICKPDGMDQGYE